MFTVTTITMRTAKLVTPAVTTAAASIAAIDIQKEQLFSPEQLTEIYRCCADSVDGEFFELTDKQEEVIRSVQQQIEVCVPDLNERIRQQEEALERVSQEQTMYVNVAIQSGLKSIIKDKLEKIFLSENKAISY